MRLASAAPSALPRAALTLPLAPALRACSPSVPKLQLGVVHEWLGRPEKMQYQLVESTAARRALGSLGCCHCTLRACSCRGGF